MVLCWVAPSGDLEHYYRIQPNATHLESTKAGDAFVLSVLDEGNKTKTKIKSKPLVNEHTVVAAYQPMNEDEQDHFVVIKVFPSYTRSKHLRGVTTDDKLAENTNWKLYIR